MLLVQFNSSMSEKGMKMLSAYSKSLFRDLIHRRHQKKKLGKLYSTPPGTKFKPALFFSLLYQIMLSAQPAYALARATFKRAQRGLFGGKHIQFGNNVKYLLRIRRSIAECLVLIIFLTFWYIESLLQEKD